MGQEGSANIAIQLKNTNLMKSEKITDYSMYLLLQTLVTRIKHNNRTKTNNMFYTLLKQPNTRSNNLLKLEKYIKSIQTYPREYKTNVSSVDKKLENFSIDFVQNIINAINIKSPNTNVVRTEKIIQTKKLINLYPNQYEHIEDKYYSFTDPYKENNVFFNTSKIDKIETDHGIEVPYNSEHSFSPKLTINLNSDTEISQFYKHYIFTYLYQNYNYKDETLQTPIDIRGTKYTINLNENAEIIIRVNKTRSCYITEDTGTKVYYMSGVNKYLIQLKSTNKIPDTEEYETIPLDIEISPAIITPYIFMTTYNIDLRSNIDYEFKNEVWGIDIQILFNYYNNSNKIIDSKLIPFSFILDKGMITDYDNDIISITNYSEVDNYRIIKPFLLDTSVILADIAYRDMVQNVRNILSNTIKLTTKVNNNSIQISTLPNINLIAINKAAVHADIRVGEVKEQNNHVWYTCYPTEYYLPVYTGSTKPQPNYRGTKWEYVKLFDSTFTGNQEEFIKQRKKDELKLRKIFKKIGIDLETLAFSEYHSGHTFISKTTNKKMVMQKFPFRSLFDRDELTEGNIYIPSENNGVYYKYNSSAIFSGLEFSLSLYKGNSSNKMSVGEIAYIYHFIETLILQINNIKELQSNQVIRNIILQSNYGYDRNYITKRLIINSSCNVYNKNNSKFNEYKKQYNNSKNKYWINFIDNNNIEICLYNHKNKITVLTTELNFYSAGYLYFNKEDIRVFVDGIKKKSNNGYTGSVIDNISLLSESQDTGIPIPINIEVYRRIPPYLRLNTYVNSSTLALYSIGLGAGVKVKAWVSELTKALSVLALFVSIFLTVVFPPVGAWGIAGAITGITGGLTGFIVPLLVEAGVIDSETAAIISITIGAISLITSIGSTITAPTNLLLNVSNTIVQSISLTTEIITTITDISYKQAIRKLAEERNSFLTKAKERQDEYNSVIDKYKEDAQLTMNTLMDIFYGNEYTITPTQFFNVSKTIGFNYNMLYKASDDISNYVSNCLRLK